MYNRVIKAGVARLLPPDEMAQETPTPGTAAHLPAATGEETQEPNRSQEYQAAYDELIETATNEVALMLEDARSEAADIRREALEEAAAAREQAQKEGYDEGLLQGRSEGTRQAEQRFATLFDEGRQQIAKAEEEARGHYEALLDGMQQDILRLSLAVAEKIVGKSLAEDSSAFVSLVQAALAAVKTESNLSVRLNPRELSERFQSEASLFDERRGEAVPLISDGAVPPGDCWIETEGGIADASVEAQLEQIAFHLGLPPKEEK